jgi:hypothetical protein
MVDAVRAVFEPVVLQKIDKTIARLHRRLDAAELPRAFKNISILSYDCDVYNKQWDVQKQKEKAAQKGMFDYYVSPAIPTKAAIDELVKFVGDFDRVIEINSRRGLWARLMELSGISIAAVEGETRVMTPDYNDTVSAKSVTTFFDENQEDFTCLMLCRAGMQGDKDTALHCIRNFTGYKIIIMADAEDPAFLELQGEKSIWEIESHIEIPCWYNGDTFLLCYKRKKTE